MAYSPHWSLKVLMSAAFIVCISVLYNEVLTSAVSALDGVGGIDRRANIMLAVLIITTSAVLAAALAISYFFEMYITSAIILALAVWIATPIISNFYLNTSPLS